MIATFARKRSILQESKYPQEISTTRWAKAEKPVTQFVVSGATDLGFLDLQIDILNSEEPDTEFKLQNRDLCVEALTNFKLLSNQMDFAKFKLTAGPTKKRMLIDVNGVSVSVLPHIILEGITRKGDHVVGGIKFSFPKTKPLVEESANFLSILIHWHAEEYLADKGKPHIRLCHAIDIPTATVFEPPKTYKRRRQQLQEACNEIVQRWPNVEPPRGYVEGE
jgi:hypothetical protein